ncbi:MAG: hypothetical protein QOC66_2087, partial [Pseudonocardiales bacterium]|nr:hypothetical protein [Pseudonocardiales bacterium]
LPLGYTAAGNGPTTLGLATLHQTPLWDGSVYWSVVADGCSGHVLQPAQTCTIMLRFAPKRPNGYPQGTIGGWVSLPDGQSIPARAAIQAKVVPLPGQPVGVVAHGAFRHLVLTWSPPPVYLGNWQYPPAASLTYHVYRVLPGGSREAVADTQHTFLVIPGLPDDSTGTYLVTASQAATTGPDSVPGAGTTATSEALVADFYGGLMNRRLAPSPETAFSDFYGSGVYGGAGSEYEDLAVSRDESVLALTYEYAHESPMLHSSVLTTRVDGTTGAGFTTVPTADSSPEWDIDPALSPNGSHIVFTHADQAGDLTELRIASTAPGAIASTVPGSAGLGDAAFSADGNAVVAVQPFDSSTRLVRLDLSTGELTPLEGTTGLGQPDVAADGRIVATIGTDQTHPDASGLVIYDAGTITAIAAAQSGTNCHPEFSAAGATVFYRHSDTAAACDRLPTNALDLATGATASLTSDSFASTAYVLHADGAHDADTTAPAPKLTAPTGAATLADSVTARWSATDPKVQGAATSGVGSYDVRYRSATASHGFGSYHAWLTGTRLTSATLPVAIGTQYCLSVRARDLEGNTSAWSTERCFAKPLDDRALTTAATRLASTNFYHGTYTRAAATGAALHRENATADRIGILVGTCPECGRLDVWLAGKYLGRLNTRTATTLYRRILWLPVFAQRSGTLVIKSTSAAPIRIDGVVSLRSAI